MKASAMRVFCAFLILLSFARPGMAMEWEQVSPYPTSAVLTCVAHGGNIDVAAGENGIVYSEDAGNNWVRVAERDGVTVTDLKYGNGVFVATTLNNGILRSADGKKWTSETTGVPYFYCLVFANGLFAAGGAEGSVATSTDGVNWKVTPNVSPIGLSLGAYGNGRFIFKEPYPDPDGKQYGVVSTDGSNWSRVQVLGVARLFCMPPTFPPSPIPNCGTADWRGLVFAKGFFYAHVTWIGPNVNMGWYFKSADGVNWAQDSGSQPVSWYPVIPTYNPGPTDLTFLNGRFIQLGYANGGAADIFSSADLASWTTNSVQTDPDHVISAIAITTNASSYLVVGGLGMIARGASLDSLKREDSPQKYLGIVTAAAHGETIVAGGRTPHGVQVEFPNRLLMVSTNRGKEFFMPTSVVNSLRSISTVRYIASRFIAVGAGQILSSTDGVDWKFANYQSSFDLYDITYDGQTWVAVGALGGGTILTSTNEIDFSPVSSAITVPLYGITHGNGMFVASGANGSIVRSNNGVDWTVSNVGDGAKLWSIAFGNGRFVAVGDGGKIFVSTNAVDWTMQQVGAGPFARIAFAHGMFAAVVDLSSETYYSTDGLNWIRRLTYRAFLRDIAACDDVFWVSGVSSANFGVGPFVLREREDTPVRVSASSGFTLRLESTPIANYRIYSADAIEGPWESREVLTNVIGDISWRETNAASIRFYKVRQE